MPVPSYPPISAPQGRYNQTAALLLNANPARRDLPELLKAQYNEIADAQIAAAVRAAESSVAALVELSLGGGNSPLLPGLPPGQGAAAPARLRARVGLIPAAPDAGQPARETRGVELTLQVNAGDTAATLQQRMERLAEDFRKQYGYARVEITYEFAIPVS